MSERILMPVIYGDIHHAAMNHVEHNHNDKTPCSACYILKLREEIENEKDLVKAIGSDLSAALARERGLRMALAHVIDLVDEYCTDHIIDKRLETYLTAVKQRAEKALKTSEVKL